MTKVKKTYHDEQEGQIHDLETLKSEYLDKGERPEWIAFVFEELEKKGQVSFRWCKLELINQQP